MSIIYKRPVVSFCMMMVSGILTAFVSNSIIVTASLFLLLLSCFYAFGKTRGGGFFVPAGMLLFFLLGSLEFLFVDQLQLRSFADFEGNEVAVRGFIVSEPEVKGEKVTYIVKVSSIRPGYSGAFIKSRGKVLLTTLVNNEGSFFDYGRELVFEGVLSQPQGVRNPGGFDYRRYLAQKGVGASVFSYAYAIEPGEGKKGNFLVQAGLRIRKRIVYVIENSLPRQQAGLLNGMLIGYREGLSEEVQDAFSNAGLTHIMAVSGANVAFLILPLAFLLKLLRIRKAVANLMLIAFLILFVFVTGFEPSVLRAVVMASILLIAAILYREPDTYAALALSCIILLTASPCMLFNIGFQLSFGATLAIVMLYRNIKKLIAWPFLPDWIMEILAATLAAQLGVLPITLVYFNKVSLIAIIPNLLAVPMLELITILGMLMALVGQFSLFISQLLGYLNSVFLSAVLYITKLASSVPFATIKTVTPPFILAVTYYIFVWFLLWYKPLKGITLKPRHAAIALSFAAVFVLTGSLQPGRLEVVFLDVGEGDSTFIRTYSGKTMLIDGGGSANPSRTSKIGESVILPFLLDSGVSRLDAVIASHPHADHIQGLSDVLEQMKVDKLILPSLTDESGFAGLLQAAGDKNVQVSRCSEGETIRLDDRTYLQVLSPEQNCSVDEASLNNTSLVLKLCYGQTEVLFTGDAETEVEDELVADGSVLAADVIKIAHHGSLSSTGTAFLEKVNPLAAIISVGKNYFGHPSPVTLALLEQSNVNCFRTDECGAVVMKSDGRTIKIKRTVTGK